MSNKTILDRLLIEIDAHDSCRSDRDAFAERFMAAIEALEGVPYSVIAEGRDWQYHMETEGYFEKEGVESEKTEVRPELKAWVKKLIEAHS